MSIFRLSFLSLAFACGDKSDDTSAETPTESTADSADENGEDTEDADENSICDEAYSFCGDILMPTDMVGTPRSMAISLYDTLNPAGPPNVVVTEIDAPDVAAGEPYRIEFSPLIETGEYYLFVFLYMEGGGEWAPVPGIDYNGNTTELVVLNGSGVTFPTVELTLAE